MSDYATLRQMAQSMPSVTLDSAALLELLDAAESITVVLPKESKKRGPRDPRAATPEDEHCAQWLFGALKRRKPDVREPNLSAWSDDVRLMRERDKRTHRQICELFLWAQSDTFWRVNIRCPGKLREKWDQLDDARDAGNAPKPGAAPGQKFNFADADRSGDQALQADFMQRHSIEVPAEDVPL